MAEPGPEEDPNIFFGNGEFEMANGDKYVGDYCAHRYGLIWREGRGVYITKDEQTYEGEWKDDKLMEGRQIIIKYPTGEAYRGTTEKDKYSGHGVYTFENKMDISSEFVDNRPTGNVVLIDINGRLWEGIAGESRALLLPENVFFLHIGESEGVGKLKPKYAIGSLIDRSSQEGEGKENCPSDRELEKIYFAKSGKTGPDVNFADSKWYQRYRRYVTMLEAVSTKLEEEEDLTEEELKWYRKYQKFKRHTKAAKKEKKLEALKSTENGTKLLDKFYSKEFKNSCPPMKVVRPTKTSDEQIKSDETGEDA